MAWDKQELNSWPSHSCLGTFDNPIQSKVWQLGNALHHEYAIVVQCNLLFSSRRLNLLKLLYLVPVVILGSKQWKPYIFEMASLICQPPVGDYQRVINSSLHSMTSREINDTLRKFWKIDTLDIQENDVQAW